ncbi:hypothetical protein DXG03_008916 [Asterophora parasitica]|uniref:GPI inositol-deacylase n=1 Tax=Asterophora parasitica TaxID=117018 RepID=A0A9P7KEG9_9AGAR|nr:hypothetical protein DXG03_008916 [Asterophora parasitica]
MSSPPKQPVLRWLAGLSAPTTPPSLALLAEALQDSLPPPPSLPMSPPPSLPEPPPLARPPPARLPDSFHASRTLTRAPAFLDSLARSTLPTASLSPPLRVARSPSLTHSTSTRSSLDTLRSLSSRSSSSAAPIPAPSTAWWWFQPDTKQQSLLSQDDPAEQQQQKLHDKYRSPKNPVVFCHGLLGFDSVTIGPSIAPMQVTHWRGIKEVLEANGTEVLITRVPATSSPVDRAKVLEAKISQVYPGRSVHLIGHSMGGLDCRYLTTHLTHRKFNVLSITTIATPHRGSSFADHFLSTVGAARMPSILSLLDLLPNGGGDGKAFESLTVESMRKFNQETPDVEGVRYFSWGAVYEPGLIDTWKWPHSVILEKEGPNDGLVSVESSKWGTYLGTLSHVNHLDLIGWINAPRYKWAEIMGKEIKFRPATFYLGVADMLAGEVDGVPKDDGSGESHDGKKGDDEVRLELGETIDAKEGSGTTTPVPGEQGGVDGRRTPQGLGGELEESRSGSGQSTPTTAKPS